MTTGASTDEVLSEVFRQVHTAIGRADEDLTALVLNDARTQRRRSLSPKTARAATPRSSISRGNIFTPGSISTRSYSRSPVSQPRSASRPRTRHTFVTPTGRGSSNLPMKLRNVEATRLIEKKDKVMSFKQVFALNGPFGKLMKDVQEIPLISSTVSCGATVCRTGNNSVLITSHSETPHSTSTPTEQKWSFGSETGLTVPELTFPLIPKIQKGDKNLKWISIAPPFTIAVYQKITPGKSLKILEAIEIRSQGTKDVFTAEAFSEPCDRKTEKLGYEERVFIGEGIVRIVSETSLLVDKLDYTNITRHMWTCDLLQDAPVVVTAKDKSPPGPGFSLSGSLSDTSAGSGSASPQSRNTIMEKGMFSTPPGCGSSLNSRNMVTNPTNELTSVGSNASTMTVTTKTMAREKATPAKSIPKVPEAKKEAGRELTSNATKTPPAKQSVGLLSSFAKNFSTWWSQPKDPNPKVETTRSDTRIGLNSILPIVGPEHKLRKRENNGINGAFQEMTMTPKTANKAPKTTTPKAAAISSKSMDTPTAGVVTARSIGKSPTSVLTPGGFGFSRTPSKMPGSSPCYTAITPGGLSAVTARSIHGTPGSEGRPNISMAAVTSVSIPNTHDSEPKAEPRKKSIEGNLE